MAYVIHVWQRCHGVAPSKLHLQQTMSHAWSFSEPMHGSGSERQRCFCCMHSCPRVRPAITVGQNRSTNLAGTLVSFICPTTFHVSRRVTGTGNWRSHRILFATPKHCVRVWSNCVS